MYSNLIELAALEQEYAINARHYLHKNPELSGEEDNTVRYIIDELVHLGIEYVNIPDGGVIGIIEGKGEGKTLLLRADIDALPMQEAENNLKQRKAAVSHTPNVAHTCGHDAHTAILLGAAKALLQNDIITAGRVIFMFERGEEATSNVVNIIRYFESENIQIDAAFGLHMSADLHSGKIAISPEPPCAGMCNLKATVKGNSNTFYSENKQGGDVVKCFSRINGDILSYKLRKVSAKEQFSYSLCTVATDEEHEFASPKSLTFSGSARFFEYERMSHFAEYFKTTIKNHAKLEGCTYAIDELEVVLGNTKNNKEVTQITESAFKSVFGGDAVTENKSSMGSETFSFISALYPSVFVYLGTKNEEIGTGAAHHNPYFDVDDSVLKFGIAAHITFVAEMLESHKPIQFTKEAENLHALLQKMQNL